MPVHYVEQLLGDDNLERTNTREQALLTIGPNRGAKSSDV